MRPAENRATIVIANQATWRHTLNRIAACFDLRLACRHDAFAMCCSSLSWLQPALANRPAYVGVGQLHCKRHPETLSNDWPLRHATRLTMRSEAQRLPRPRVAANARRVMSRWTELAVWSHSRRGISLLARSGAVSRLTMALRVAIGPCVALLIATMFTAACGRLPSMDHRAPATAFDPAATTLARAIVPMV